jgi:hypothetical protein
VTAKKALGSIVVDPVTIKREESEGVIAIEREPVRSSILIVIVPGE